MLAQKKWWLTPEDWVLTLEYCRLTTLIQEQVGLTEEQWTSPRNNGGFLREPWKLKRYECSEAHPGAVKAHSGAVKAHSGALEAHTGAVEAHPGAVEAHHGAMKAHPGAVEAHPGLLRLTLELWKRTMEL